MRPRSSPERSAFFVRRIATMWRPISWPTDSSPSFWPTDLDSSVPSHASSCFGVMFTFSPNSRRTSSASSEPGSRGLTSCAIARALLLLQRARLVDRLAAGLLALDEVLGIVLGGAHLPAGLLRVRGDLLLHLAHGLR